MLHINRLDASRDLCPLRLLCPREFAYGNTHLWRKGVQPSDIKRARSSAAHKKAKLIHGPVLQCILIPCSRWSWHPLRHPRVESHEFYYCSSNWPPFFHSSTDATAFGTICLDHVVSSVARKERRMQDRSIPDSDTGVTVAFPAFRISRFWLFLNDLPQRFLFDGTVPGPVRQNFVISSRLFFSRKVLVQETRALKENTRDNRNWKFKIQNTKYKSRLHAAAERYVFVCFHS